MIYQIHCDMHAFDINWVHMHGDQFAGQPIGLGACFFSGGVYCVIPLSNLASV